MKSQRPPSPSAYGATWLAYRLNLSLEERQRHVGRGVRKPTRTETQFANAPIERKGNRQPSLAIEIGCHVDFGKSAKRMCPIRHHHHVTGAEQGGVRPSVGIDRGKPQAPVFCSEVGTVEIARHPGRNFSARRGRRVVVLGLLHFPPPGESGSADAWASGPGARPFHRLSLASPARTDPARGQPVDRRGHRW